MKTRRTEKTGFVAANVTAALLELALAALVVAALAAGADVTATLLAGTALAALSATVALHVQLVVRHSHQGQDAAAKTPSNPGDVVTCATDAAAPVKTTIAKEMLAPAATAHDGSETHDLSPVAISEAVTHEAAGLNIDALCERLIMTADPIGELRLLVGDIHAREAGDKGPAPTPFERFAARALDEAGLSADDVELPSLRVVRPAASQMFYLRVGNERMPYLAKVRVLAIEAALNAMRLCATYFDEPNDHSVEEHYRLSQRLARSICAQSPNLGERVPVIEDEHPDTEWAVRLGISTAIESLRLPYRLTANWRVNVTDGNVAIELDLTPEGVFPASAYVDGIGLVATSREMRRKAASDYALRLAILVAACAFRCSESVHHVWVGGIVETANRRSCYLSVDFDRWRFSKLDLANLGPLEDVYHLFAPQLRYEGGVLRPVRQTFSLGERRFCPPRRYENIGLSNRRLTGGAATSLGTDHVSGLAINESDKRQIIAVDIMRALTDSTADNVSAILKLAADDPDLSVRAAAERTVSKLIDGSLSNEPMAVGEEFVEGDALSRAVGAAQQSLSNQDPAGAVKALRAILDPLDDAGAYADSPTVEWRYFSSYVGRTMYNRLCAHEGHTLLLVPDAYFNAHLLLSMALLAQGRAEDALTHAKRLIELSPLDARARLHATRCLEALGRQEEAIEMLSSLLVAAHDPHSLGFGYYRMAFFQWQRGNLVAAQACYQRALSFMPGATPVIATELALLAMQNPGSVHEELSTDEAENALRAAGVPVAPTEIISQTFLDAARASLDAEVFPVARNFINILGAFSGDDILMGVIRSIEEEPDF